MSALNANAREWRPTGPPMVELPPTTEEQHQQQQQQHIMAYEEDMMNPHNTVYVYDSDGEGELIEHDGQFGFEQDDDENDEEASSKRNTFHPPASSRANRQFTAHSAAAAFRPAFPNANALKQPQQSNTAAMDGDDEEYARHMAEFDNNTFYMQDNGMPYVPPPVCNTEEELDQVDWEEQAREYMMLQRTLIQKQLDVMREREEARAARLAARMGGGAPAAAATQNAAPPAAAAPQQRQQQQTVSKATTGNKSGRGGAAPASSAVKPTTAAPTATAKSVDRTSVAPTNNNNNNNGTVLPPASSSWASVVRGTTPAAGGGAAPSVTAASSSAAPLTVNGNHRWKKLTKAQQRQQQAQKQAFESFANSLLHSASPFMAPLRLRTKTSLPKIKVDQRFGKRGVPQSAVAQFVVAPMVVNYHPRHFDELSPGDIMEFHYDFAQVLKALPTANCISFCYGPEWKPYAIPYCYVSCRDYKQEVLSLCPQEVPNSRSEALYEDDIVKDVTNLVLAIDGLHDTLSRMSVLQCMSRRVNLSSLYEAFATVFEPVGNYQIQIRDLDKTPSTFLIKTSRQVLDQLENGGKVVLYGDETLWDALEVVDYSFQSGKGTVVLNSNNNNGVSSEPATQPQTAVMAPPVTSAATAASTTSRNVVVELNNNNSTTKSTPPASAGGKTAVAAPPTATAPRATATTTTTNAAPPSSGRKQSTSPSSTVLPWVAVGAFCVVCIAATTAVVIRSTKRH